MSTELGQGTNSQWDRPLPMQCTQPITCRSLVIPVKLLSSGAADPEKRTTSGLGKSPGLLKRNASNCASERHLEHRYRQIHRCSCASQRHFEHPYMQIHRCSCGKHPQVRRSCGEHLRLRFYLRSSSSPSERRSDIDLSSSATSSRISTESQHTAKQPLKQLKKSTDAFGAKLKKDSCRSAHSETVTEPTVYDEGSPSFEFEVLSPSKRRFLTGTSDAAAATSATDATSATSATTDASRAGSSWRAVPITGAGSADGSRSHGRSVSPANMMKGGAVYEHNVQQQTTHQPAQRTAMFGMGQDQLSRKLMQSMQLAELLSRKRRQQQQQGLADNVWPPTHLVGNFLLDKSHCDLQTTDQCRSPSPDMWPPQSLPWPGCRVRLTVKVGEATCQEMNNLKRSCQTRNLQQRPQQIYWPFAAFTSSLSGCNSNNSNANNSSSHMRLSTYANIRAMYNWTRQMSSEILQRRLQRAIECAQALDTNCSASSFQDSQSGQCDSRLYDSMCGSDLYSLTEKLKDVSPEPERNPETLQPDCDMCRRERMRIFCRSPSAHYGRRRREPRFVGSIVLQSNASPELTYQDFHLEEAAALYNYQLSNAVRPHAMGGSSGSGGDSSEIAELELAVVANRQWQPQPQQPQPQGQWSERGSSELVEIELAPLKDEKTLAAPDDRSGRTTSSSSLNPVAEIELSSIEINSDGRRVRSRCSSRTQWGVGHIPSPSCPPIVTLPRAAFCLRGSLSSMGASSLGGCRVHSSSDPARRCERRMTRPMASEWRKRPGQPDMPPRPSISGVHAHGRVKSRMALQAKPSLPTMKMPCANLQTSIVVDPPPMAFIRHRRAAESQASSLQRASRSSGQRKTLTSPKNLSGYSSQVEALKGSAGGSSELQSLDSEDPLDPWREGKRAALGKPTMPPPEPPGDVYGTKGKTTVQVLKFQKPTGLRALHEPLKIRPPNFLSQQQEDLAKYSKQTGLLKVEFNRGNYSNSTEVNEARQAVGTVSPSSSPAEFENAAAEPSWQLSRISDKAAQLSFVTSAQL